MIQENIAKALKVLFDFGMIGKSNAKQSHPYVLINEDLKSYVNINYTIINSSKETSMITAKTVGEYFKRRCKGYHITYL